LSLTFAHFTPTELPGTFAVLALGILIGIALFAPSRTMRVALLATVGAVLLFGVLGYGGHRLGWAEGVRLAIDGLFLLGALLALGAFTAYRLLRSRARPEAIGSPPADRPG
jgi:uncharacterized membrane protein YccC